MARNPVQFQKGISLNAFLSLYGTEDQCFDALYQWRWPNGFVCPHCGHDRCCQLNSRKLQQCNRCHRQTSITAGTIFDSTKLPLTVWFHKSLLEEIVLWLFLLEALQNPSQLLRLYAHGRTRVFTGSFSCWVGI